ncbi:MAG: serine hydrolase domain-containing protein [Bacteroidota bacterium]
MAYSQTSSPEIDSMINKALNESGIPALTAAVITLDDIQFGIGGTTQINGEEKVTLKNKFHLGSNSKAITAFIAMKLEEEGKLKLEDKAIELRPEIKGKINEAFVNTSLGDFLSHQAGVQPYTAGAEFLKVADPEGSLSEQRAAFSKFVLKEDAVTKGTYSNAGYAIAAWLMESVAEMSFEDLLDKYFNELELEHFLGFPNKETISNPWGHMDQGQGLTALPPDHFYQLRPYAAPFGDIAMNIIDYSKFIQLNLQGLNETDNFLKAENYKKLHFGFDNYSYGWGNTVINGKKVSSHDGSAGTYYCHTILIPEAKLAVIIMANSASQAHVTAIYQLREALIINYLK